MKVGYQGVKNSYSESLFNKFKNDYKLDNFVSISYKNFENIFNDINRGKIDFGLIPIENRIGGSLHCNYDNLLKYDLSIILDLYYPINHCLIGLQDSKLEEIDTCYSHYQALAQCNKYLKSRNILSKEYFDTAGSARLILEKNNKNWSIIANKEVAKSNNLKILENNIQDIKKNYTRFVIVTKNKKIPINLGYKNKKYSIVFSLMDKIGSLSNILKIFYNFQINLSKIESRPNNFNNNDISSKFKYLFYIDFEGDTEVVNIILDKVRQKTEYFKLIGSYPTILYKNDFCEKLKIGIIGFGRFGKFLGEKFVKYGNISAWSRTDYTETANKMNIKFYTDLKDIIKFNDIIVISVSIKSFREMISNLKLDEINKNLLIVDVLSVKNYPFKILKKFDNKHDILCTHPMFGPDSGKYGWTNLPFLFHPHKITNTERLNRFLNIFANEGCKMVNINCKNHDKYLLRNQFITHFIGRMLRELKLKNKYMNLSTEGYKSLIKIINNTCNDSFDLFRGLFKFNKNGNKILTKLLQSYFKIIKKLKSKTICSSNVNYVSISKTALTAKKVFDYELKNICEGNRNILLKLHIGEFSDMNTKYINSVAKEVLNNNKILYTRVGGLLKLKEEICKDIKNRKSCEYKKENVILSNGAKQSVYQVIKLLCNIGDEVIVISPYWTSYPEMVKLTGATPIIVEANQENKFFPTNEQFKEKITKNTKLIIICNPNNPTGMIIEKERMDNFVNFIKEYKNIFILSDEIYERIDFDKKHISFGNYNDIYNNLFIVNGFSKVYCMTGYRLGYTLGPRRFIKDLTKIQSHITGSPNSIAQYTALNLLKKEETNTYINNVIERLDMNRTYLYFMLKRRKEIDLIKPDGGYYLFINMKKIINKKFNDEIIKDVEQICDIFLYKYNVAITPGIAFGKKNYVRLSYSVEQDKIELFVKKFNSFLSKIK